MKKTLRVKKKLEQIKKLYAEVDQITNELLAKKFKHDDIAFFVDNFRDKNLLFRTTAFRRWELKFYEKSKS